MPRKKAAPDLELAAGSAAHYEDPTYYQKTYAKRADDVAFYVARAREADGPVLEYGCGNGRIALPTARAGASLVGVDLSEAMLGDLRARLLLESAEVQRRVAVHHGDMRSFATKKRFALITCPFNAFLHLYTRDDVERFLARVSAHLTPRGRFVFDVSIPDASELARKHTRLFRTRPFVYPGVGRVRYGERFDYEPLRQVLFVSMEFEPESPDVEAFTTPLAHRQFYPQELEALLHYNGFAIESQLGDFDGRVTPEARTLVVCAQKRSKK